MTSENVDELVETTRSAMVTTLESISRPGPAHQHDVHVAPEDLQTPRAELPRQLGHPIGTSSSTEPTPRRRKQENSDESGQGSSEMGSELSKVESRGGETTDDEMDDDAVLLRRPKAA
jgi:lysophosphatidate acyltransferase